MNQRPLPNYIGFSAKVATASLLLSAGVTAAAPPLSVQLTTVDTDISTFNVAAWWSPVARDSRGHATYLGYLKPQPQAGKRDDVWIARVTDSGEVAQIMTGAEAVNDPGHTQVSIALDGAAGLHVFSGMHGGAIQYRHSASPASSDASFVASEPEAFSGGDFTYPNLTTDPDGDVWMIIRDYPAGRLFHYSLADKAWSRVCTFANQAGSTLYPDQILAGPDGQLHLIWEWAAGEPQATRHYGTYARFDPKTRSLFRADGSPFAGDELPFKPGTGDVYQSLEGSEQFAKGVHGVQSAKLTLADPAAPVITYSYSADGTATGYGHRLARWDGTKWLRTVIDSGPYDLNKSWISCLNGTLRVYGTVPNGHPSFTGTQDLFVRTSDDLGKTWSEPTPLTKGLNIQRPVGISADGVDYLFLPDLSSRTLYLAVVK